MLLRNLSKLKIICREEILGNNFPFFIYLTSENRSRMNKMIHYSVLSEELNCFNHVK